MDEEYEEQDDFEYIFDTFKENIKYFDFDLSDIELLESLEVEDLCNPEYIYKITPLLSEIADYALVCDLIDFNIFPDLVDDNKGDIYGEIGVLSEACTMYLCMLREYDCEHPTVLKYHSFLDAVVEYETLIDGMHAVKNLNSPLLNINLLDMYALVYTDILIQTDSMNHAIAFNVQYIDDPRLLMQYLAFACKAQYQQKALLTNPDNPAVLYYIDNKDNKEKKEKVREFVVKIDDSTKELTLNSTISYLDDINSPTVLGLELSESITQMSHSYRLYKGYQYRYIKSCCKEAEVLSLCK